MRDGHELGLHAGIDGEAGAGEIAGDEHRNRAAFVVLGSVDVIEPLVAPFEHGHQQLLQARGVVVKVAQGIFYRASGFALVFEQCECAQCGSIIVRGAVFADGGLRAEAGEERHLPREAGAECIDGGDAQARWIGEQAPAAFGIARKGIER